MDWTFLVRIVVSFLCVVLAFDTFSGEHERGTLRSVLANPVSRAQVLVGKTAAHLTVLMTAVVLGVVVSLLVMSVGEAIQLGRGRAEEYPALFGRHHRLWAAVFAVGRRRIGAGAAIRQRPGGAFAFVGGPHCHDSPGLLPGRHQHRRRGGGAGATIGSRLPMRRGNAYSAKGWCCAAAKQAPWTIMPLSGATPRLWKTL